MCHLLLKILLKQELQRLTEIWDLSVWSFGKKILPLSQDEWWELIGFFEGNKTFWKIIKLKSLMEENIVGNQALTRNKELAGDKIATIDNKIMNINNYLDSTSWQWLTWRKRLRLFLNMSPSNWKKRHGIIGLIYPSEIRKTWSNWICYQEGVYKYHCNH